MTIALFAAAWEVLGHPDKLLAIVGGAAVGGFGLGFLVQMAVRGWTGQQVPRWILMTLRVLAGGISGWLVALWVLGYGGGGLGGPGGDRFGGNGGENKPAETSKAKDETEPKEDDAARKVATLYVEVLGSNTLNRLGEKNPDRCYRLETPNGSRLLTLKEVENYITQRATEKPPLKGITIVLYNDGPSRNVPKVSDLAEWASVPVVAGSDERLSVGFERRMKDAPVQ